MSTRGRRILLFAVLLSIVIIAAYVFWPTGLIDTPISDAVRNGNLTDGIAATPLTPNASQSTQPAELLTATDPEMDDPLMPEDDRVRLVGELLDKNLPIQPNYRKTVKRRLQSKTIKQMVKEIGDPWAASTPSTMDMANDLESTLWLVRSFASNLRVKRLIQEGRKYPELVGFLVSADLMKRTSEWFDTVEAFEKEYAEGGSSGFVVAHDGETTGSTAFQKYLEDQYAIPAETFVLMNIEYSKALDTLAELVYRTENCGIKKVMTPDGPVHMLTLSSGNKPAKDRLNADILYYAAATLLQNNTDEKYAELKATLEKQLKDKPPVFREITTDSPDALWPQDGIPFTAMAGVDTSSEPKMNLLLPNFDLETMHNVGKGTVPYLLYMIYKDTEIQPTSGDPNN